MNTYPPARSPRGAISGATTHAPHAALLIDFDNVTLGIRSDLTKELRTLLDSEIIRGKVAVQRAYADWRRYPQYIVPLSESSIDLIFAPAFGTNKKNATDIRLAVDAIELVFTRPEIGTFILLSGDSDFSSLVIKLKEYGKYVIGVGIRESASDLLIQNCDEYYSYSDLAGLTREADLPSIQRDPWELVVEAVETMVRNDDVMRSDRLKQVMQQIDPNFDEKNAGFNRFSKFVTEAGNRGLIRTHKLDNGQYEIALAQKAAPRPAAPARAAKPAPAERKAAPPERKGAPPERKAAPPPPAPAPVPTAPSAADEDGRRGRRGRRGRGREREPARETPRAPAGPLTLAEAFQLMQRALTELPAPVPHDKLRARMVVLYGREDPLLDAQRFPRLLRQANDAEAADVRKIDDEMYEVLPHRIQLARHLREEAERASARPAEAPVTEGDRVEPEPKPAPVPAEPAEAAAATTAARALRFRRGSRGPLRPTEVPLVGVVRMDEEPEPETTAGRMEETEADAKPAARPRRARKSAKAAQPAEVSGGGERVAPKGARRPRRSAKPAPGDAGKPAEPAEEKNPPRRPRHRTRSKSRPSGAE